MVDKDTVFNPSTTSTYFAVNSYAQGIIMQNGTNNYINLLTGTQTLSTTFASPGVGTQKKLVFVWKNDGSGGNGAPSIIDNIALNVIVSCPTPTNLSASNVTSNSADLTWLAGASETTWQVRIGETGTPIDVTSALYPLSNLTPNTSYTVYVRANCGATFSNWVSYTFTTLAVVTTPPTVVTTPATAIAQTIATLNGTITAGNETITAQGFEWKEVSAADWIIVSATGATITHNLTGLTANTAYEFKSFATTATGTEYGATQNFTTLAIVPPTVVTTPATITSGTEAILNGTITVGSEEITAQGFEWKAASATDWTNVIGTLSDDALTYNLIALTANTAYEFKAYVTTASGTLYGETLNFTTLGLTGVDGKEISIMMYPNPATSHTNLIVEGVSGETKIVVSDVQGRILNTINTKAVNGVVEQTIDLNNLAKGVYYIRIQNSNINRTQKLIVR